MGGHVALMAKNDIEKNLGKSIVSSTNSLNYKYSDGNMEIEEHN